MNLGFSGRLTRATIRSPLTPLFLLAALAAGLVALLTIPREEEPQILVPMVDIVVQANGLRAPDAVELVTKPLEAIVKAIPGVEHVSVTMLPSNELPGALDEHTPLNATDLTAPVTLTHCPSSNVEYKIVLRRVESTALCTLGTPISGKHLLRT